MESKKGLWNTFIIRMAVLVLLTILSLSFTTYFVINHQYNDLTINELQNRANVIYEYVEDVLPKESFAELNTIDDEQKDVYKTTQKQLQQIKEIANVRYLYTAKKTASGEYIYVVDGLDPGAKDYFHIGTPIEDEIIPDLSQCIANKAFMGDEIMVADWGIVFVTYFPVHGDDGSVIGAVGIEFDCEDLYNSSLKTRNFTIGMLFIIMLVFSVIVVFILKKMVDKIESELKKKDEQLIVAKEEALKNSKAKGDFLSRMSHEMRTPMNAIIGMTKMADTTTDINKIRYCLNLIDASSVQLLGIINDILDMSKIESGKFDLETVPLNIERIIEQVTNLIIDQVEKNNQNLKVKIDSNMGLDYMGDALRLSQVLTNLLSNAVKFTPEEGTITLSVEEVSKQNNTSLVRFSVTDTGIGMTAEQVKKLFTSFTQADESITRKFGGTGLGLAISKSIVDKMHGEITVESELNKGSSFVLTIPMERVTQINEVSISAKTETLEKTPDFSNITLLLTEDVEINREVFIALLENTRINIDIAENGLIAVEKFRANPQGYDIIIMDIQMPEMDGYEATKAIRGMDSSEAKSVPIIAMTANAFKEDVDKCIECGMNDHISKPIDLETVIQKIRHYMNG